MPVNLRGRSFLTLLDFSPEDIRFLLRMSQDLKAAKYGGYYSYANYYGDDED